MHRIKSTALFVIDGSYLLYRSYYALRDLKTSYGFPTNAIFSFCRTVMRITKKFDPKYLAVAWDEKGSSQRRKKRYEGYKSTREEAPSDLFLQKEKIIEFLDLVGIKQFSKSNYEADDIIAAIVKRSARSQVVVVTADKDLGQLLVHKNLLIYDPFKELVFNADDFKKEKGFPPEKVAFFYSLVGDSSDNIPGVSGVGKVTAERLVKIFDSLDDLYEHVDKIDSSSLKKKLLDGKDDAYLSIELFKLEPPKLSFKKEDLAFSKDSLVKAAGFFNELEFKSLLSSLKKEFGKNAVAELLDLSKEQQEAEDRHAGSKKLSKPSHKVRIVSDESTLKKLTDRLKQKSFVAFDTETTGLNSLNDQLVGISIAYDSRVGYYIPVDSAEDAGDDGQNSEQKFLSPELVADYLNKVFGSKKIKKIAHNGKFDKAVLVRFGFDDFEIYFDTMIAASLFRRSDDEKVGLKNLSAAVLGEKMESYDELTEKGKLDIREIAIEKVAAYAAADAVQTLKLFKKYNRTLSKFRKIKRLFFELEMPVSEGLLKMQMAGVPLKIEKIKNFFPPFL